MLIFIYRYAFNACVAFYACVLICNLICKLLPGLSLTAADTVILYDSDWNPQNDLQVC